MDSSNIPYVYKIDEEIRKAKITGDVSGVNRLISESLNEIGRKISMLVNQYPYADLPLVMAALLTTYNGLCSVVGPEGKEMADSMVQMTGCVVIDLEELVKQSRDGEEDK